MDSPVISDSSHVECPYITFPSTGTFAPGTTWKQINYGDVIFGFLTAMLLKTQVFWNATVCQHYCCYRLEGSYCL